MEKKDGWGRPERDPSSEEGSEVCLVADVPPCILAPDDIVVIVEFIVEHTNRGVGLDVFGSMIDNPAMFD